MRLLLATDGSSASQAALREVQLRPWPANTSVEVLTVTEPPHLWAMSEPVEEVARRAQTVVDRALEDLHTAGLTTEGAVISGDPRRVILDRAHKADMLFVGSHGSSPITRFLMGNVASAAVRYAPCSVEVVRLNPKRTERQAAHRILVATDGSDSALKAVHSVATRPWPEGSEFRVLSVVELVAPPISALVEPAFVHLTNVEELRADAMRQAETAIDDAVRILGPQASTSISVLLDGPKKVIVDEAEAWDADLIVVGSHGHTALDRYLMGSVSEAVAMHAPCSVEVIR